MSSGQDPEETLVLADTDAFDEDEMFENWRQISVLLRRRCDRARRAHEGDAGNARKADAYLKAAKEYHAFAFLLRQYGQVSRKLVEILEGLGPDEVDVEIVSPKKPEELN